MRPESECCPLEKGAYDLHFVCEKDMICGSLMA